MAKVLFYHLTQSTAEDTLRQLAGRAVAQGWRVMLRGTEPANLQRLDARLWSEPADSFLPHGLEGGAQDAAQPLLIGQGPIGNAAQALILIDGAEASLEDMRALERVWILFDAHVPDRLAFARDQWRAVTAAEIPAEYWSEETGRWEKKASKG